MLLSPAPQFLLLVHLLAVLAPLAVTLPGPGPSCPELCRCSLDRRGRRVVGCYEGGGEDPMPLAGVDSKVEVLEYAPTADRANMYTIGPIFQQFKRLEELNIVHSNIPAIGRNSFWGLTTLQVLNLTSNNISALLEDNFRGLGALRELYLSHNRIESVPSGAFRHLGELRVLSLARNRIRGLVSRIFLRLGKLHELDLSHNPLGDLNPEVFKDVQELRVLRSRHCGLTKLNRLLYAVLPDLEVVDLGDNFLKALSAEDFKPLRRLRELWVDGNQLPVVLEGTFRFNPMLQTVNLARNRLAKVTDEAFLNVSALRVLDLGYNRLERLDTAFMAAIGETLRTLVLSGNFLSEEGLARLLRTVPHITGLELADMRLRNLPSGVLAPLPELRTLNLSGNLLTALPPSALYPLPYLQVVDASRNRFTSLDEKSLVRLDSVEKLLLENNPWACDRCHLPPLLSRVNRSAAGSPLRELVCASPRAVAGEAIVSLSLGALAWCTGGPGPDSPRSLLAADSQLGLIAATAAVAILLLAGAGLLAIVAYSRHHADYYYTQEDKRGPENEAIFENMGAVLDDRVECKKTPKRVTIATIDELTNNPELHSLTNGS